MVESLMVGLFTLFAHLKNRVTLITISDMNLSIRVESLMVGQFRFNFCNKVGVKL